MIEEREFENGNKCTHVQFGGDICVGFFKGKESVCVSMSSIDEKVEIGKQLTGMQKKKIDELGDIVLLDFKSVKSIDVVISHLKRARDWIENKEKEEIG